MNDIESDHEADIGHSRTADPTDDTEVERCSQTEAETTETVTEGVSEEADRLDAETIEDENDIPENNDNK